MKKQILNFGKALNKAEQRTIHGGNDPCNGNGTLFLGWSELKCANAGGIWQGGKCWVCYS